MATYSYVIYRHGSNSANQSLCDKMPVALVEARNQREACETMHDGDLHSPACLKLSPAIRAWANQRFSAKPASRASAADLDAAQEYERTAMECD